MNIWFSSDPHFGHYNIIEYTNRPFATFTEMDEAIIKQYNHYVRPDDTFYIMGDIGLGNYEYIKSIISRINGNKILVLGNHDKLGHESYYNMGFKAVICNATIKLGKQYITLAHYPIKGKWALVKTFAFYIRKMLNKDRTFKEIKQRLARELKTYRLMKRDGYHLHGHVHSKRKIFGKNIDIGWDAWGKPVGTKDILKIIQKENV